MTILFYVRLALYLLGFAVPVFHPAINVPYDSLGWWLWFVLIPGEMLIAFHLSPPRVHRRIQLISAGVFFLISLGFVVGSGSSILPTLIGGLAAFFSTLIVFWTGGKLRILAVGELFFLGFHYYRLLSFSRGSESIARNSSGITQFLLILCIGSFLVHCVVIYLATHREGVSRRNAGELGAFLTISVLTGLLLAVALPPNFVRHSIVFNRLSEPLRPDIIPLDETGDGRPDRGSLQGENDEEGENGKDGEDGENGGQAEGDEPSGGILEGIPSDQWQNLEDLRQGQRDGKQYTVMVVASDIDPVYAANGYYGRFDPVSGFRLDSGTELNELAYIRLLETWTNQSPARDLMRKPFQVYFLSTLSERFLAYEPRSVLPTVLDRKYHPFDYSYVAESAFSVSETRDWARSRDLTSQEKDELSSYLEIPLSEPNRDIFQQHLDTHVGDQTGYYQRIAAILESFRSFQYNIGFTDEVSVDRMAEFITVTQEGDCTEFSNTTAILARMSGIPSRVVTGFLASRDLQTDKHYEGILQLLKVVEPLQAFTPDQLFLVTSAHRHSWVQLFMPGYGWVDIETTATALPPLGSGDPNSMDVVIPIIEEQPNPLQDFKFPWLFIFRFFVLLLGASTLGAYIFRFGRGLTLNMISRGDGTRALRALYRNLLINLATEGHKIKAPSQTALEYAEKQPETRDFADAYTELRYREVIEPAKKVAVWQRVRRSYDDTMKGCRRKGIIGLIRRIFSLRSLYY